MEHVSLIYKLLVLSVMIPEADAILEKLGLPPTGVTTLDQVKESEMSHPGLGTGVDAYFRTDSVHFAFTPTMAIIFQRLDPQSRLFWTGGWSEVGVPSGSANDKLAYTLARQWLEAIGVDVAGLERKYPVEITQDVCRAKGEGLVSPNFHVRWQNPGPTPKGEIFPIKAEVDLDTSRQSLVRFRVMEMSYWGRPPVSISNGLAISRLPDAPVREYLKEHGQEAWTDVLRLLAMSPERYQVGLRQMLAEARSLVSLLGMEDQLEVKPELLRQAFVNPPAFGCGGALDFGRRWFWFGTNGGLTNLVYNSPPYTNYAQWMGLPATISSNQALGIALEKARAISLDVDRLNRDHPRRFYRQFDPKKVKREGKTELVWRETPAYILEWGGDSRQAKPPVVEIIVDANVARIGGLRINDTSYWGRPPIFVRLPER